MYVTRPLSLYRRNPSALSELPPRDCPHSGIMVMKDEESEYQDSYCCGIFEHKTLEHFPFPQNRILSIFHPPAEADGIGSAEGGPGGAGGRIISTKVWFLPVLNQPLSSNLYYIIRAKGQYKGKACVSSSKMDICSCCFLGTYTNDLKPKPLNFQDPYQQFEIRRHHSGGFYAKSVAFDGVPPRFLRRKGWHVRSHRRSPIVRRAADNLLDAALGVESDVSVQVAPLPLQRLSFAPPAADNRHRISTVVGRWYCPFLFVKEEAKISRRMKKSLLYEITLEQYWEEIFSKENGNGNNRNENGNVSETMRVNVSVEREDIVVYGEEALKKNVDIVDGWVWFVVKEEPQPPMGKGMRMNSGKRVRKVGLSLAVVEGMRGVELERGWGDGVEMDVRVQRDEDQAVGNWRRFGCYVLVETFLVRRIDGVLIIKYIYRHTHKVQCKWE